MLLVIFCVYVIGTVQLDRSFRCAFLVENAYFNIGQLSTEKDPNLRLCLRASCSK